MKEDNHLMGRETGYQHLSHIILDHWQVIEAQVDVI